MTEASVTTRLAMNSGSESLAGAEKEDCAARTPSTAVLTTYRTVINLALRLARLRHSAQADQASQPLIIALSELVTGCRGSGPSGNVASVRATATAATSQWPAPGRRPASTRSAATHSASPTNEST